MGVGFMREFILILLFAGTFIFVVKQFALNIALVFEEEENNEKKKGRK